jgi:hypothetical protein
MNGLERVRYPSARAHAQCVRSTSSPPHAAQRTREPRPHSAGTATLRWTSLQAREAVISRGSLGWWAPRAPVQSTSAGPCACEPTQKTVGLSFGSCAANCRMSTSSPVTEVPARWGDGARVSGMSRAAWQRARHSPMRRQPGGKWSVTGPLMHRSSTSGPEEARILSLWSSCTIRPQKPARPRRPRSRGPSGSAAAARTLEGARDADVRVDLNENVL